MIIPLVYKCLNRLRFSKVNSIQYWNIMIVINNNNILKVNIYSQIILIFTFISTSLFAHPHSTNDLESQQHTHTQNENDLIYELDDFNDLNFQSSNSSSDTYSKKKPANKQMILFDDNLYLLDDEFDFGDDEFELQKMEINTDDLEIAKEYEDFLNSFFIEATLIGNKPSNSKSYTNPNLKIRQLYDKINNLKSEKEILNQKIENLEKQLQFAINDKSSIDNFGAERQFLNQKIENLEKQLQSAMRNLEKNVTNNNPPTISKSEPIGKANVLPSGQTHNTTDPSRKLGFGFSTIMGTTIPNGKITKVNFTEGPNIGIPLDTPYLFNLARMEAKFGVEIYISSMDASSANENNFDYYLTNLVGNISIFPFNHMNNQHLSSIEIKGGIGITYAAIGSDNKTSLSIPTDIIYYLPIDLSGFHIGINLHSQYTMGYPGNKGNTSFINAGLIIKTPLRF